MQFVAYGYLGGDTQLTTVTDLLWTLISGAPEIIICRWLYRGFPGSSAGKESACNVGDPNSIPELGRSPGEGIGYPLQYSYLKIPMDRRSLVGCSPWGCRESDMTE